jgi:hypothetical protein
MMPLVTCAIVERVEVTATANAEPLAAKLHASFGWVWPSCDAGDAPCRALLEHEIGKAGHEPIAIGDGAPIFAEGEAGWPTPLAMLRLNDSCDPQALGGPDPAACAVSRRGSAPWLLVAALLLLLSLRRR